MTCIRFIFPILLLTLNFFYVQAANETTIITKPKSESKPKIKVETALKNVSMETQRIMQPIAERSSNAQIGIRTLVVPNNSNVVQLNNSTDFRPSPQIDNFFEFNRLPVAPAQAESKHFPGVTLNEPLRPKNSNWLQNKQEKPIRSEEHWLDLPPPNHPPKTWFNKVNFPTHNPIFRGRDQIIAYSDETTTVQYPYVVTGTNQDTTTAKGSSDSFGTNARYPEGNVYEYGNPYDSKKGSILHKTHFEHPYGLSSPGSELHHAFPWKKIIKFLTALIPIGLLLSALTPTVINVAASNVTQARGRAQDSITSVTEQKLISSLNYLNKLDSAGCEEKVICELLLGAGSSQNAEHHIKNLLNAFTEHEGNAVQQVENLNKILKAVQREDCSSLSCEVDGRSTRDLRRRKR